MMISKELLGEVLETELKRHDSAFVGIEEMGISNSMVHINYKNTHGIICLFIINTYELAHKCKVWAFKNKCTLKSYLDYHDGKWSVEIYPNSRGMVYAKTADTEPQAIFKGCQWILENKDKK